MTVLHEWTALFHLFPRHSAQSEPLTVVLVVNSEHGYQDASRKNRKQWSNVRRRQRWATSVFSGMDNFATAVLGCTVHRSYGHCRFKWCGAWLFWSIPGKYFVFAPLTATVWHWNDTNWASQSQLTNIFLLQCIRQLKYLYQVTIGSFMCGPAKRVWKLDIEQITLHDSLDSTTKDGTSTGQALDRTFMYDRAVAEGAKIFGKRMHNLFCDNCHSHVATILNLLRYEGRSDWNQFRVCWNIWMKGSWTSTRNAFIVFSPLLFLVTVSAACAIAFSWAMGRPSPSHRIRFVLQLFLHYVIWELADFSPISCTMRRVWPRSRKVVLLTRGIQLVSLFEELALVWLMILAYWGSGRRFLT